MIEFHRLLVKTTLVAASLLAVITIALAVKLGTSSVVPMFLLAGVVAVGAKWRIDHPIQR